MVADGHAVENTSYDRGCVSGSDYFVPHHCTRPPAKFRVVFDCAAHYNSSSLNDHLLQGPDLVHSLLGILFRFRHYRFALLADISAMLYQVKLYPEDNNFVQFLWWLDGDPHKPVIKYKMCVDAFGLTLSPFIAAYALRQVALDNVAGVSDKTIATALDSFYVNDLLTSVSTEKELVSLVSEFDRLLGSRGFHLTEFSSNSERVLATIPQDRLAPLH